MNRVSNPFPAIARCQKNILLAFAFLLSTNSALPQGLDNNSAQREYIRSNYTKLEYQISMRDGIKLVTSVYAPKETSQR
jgi:predicted acyl esterase